MKIIYLITGVSGSGKSWVLDNCNVNIPKFKSDNIPQLDKLVEAIKSIKEDFAIVEKTTLVSSLIKRLPTTKVVVLIVGVDFLKVKEQLVCRGGKVTPGLYRRWKRMQVLASKYNAVVGSSQDIKKWLQSNIKTNLVYKVTAPNGKSYIGQTSKSLEIRKKSHIYEALSNKKRKVRNVLFHMALLKYLESMTWETLKENLSNEEANFWERKYIAEFNSVENGYNQTTGGRQLFAHSEQIKKLIAKKASKHSKLHWNEARKEKMAQDMHKQWENKDFSQKRSEAIKKVRGSKEQRKLTSENSKHRYADANKRNDMAAACGAKTFNVYKNGELVGTWLNAAQCAKELGFATKTHISNCLHGRKKTYCGYTFIYVPDTKQGSNINHI